MLTGSHRLNLFSLDVIGDTGFGLPMNFIQKVSDSAQAESQAGTKYQLDGMIDSLHKGVRYCVTLASITSIRVIRALKLLVDICPLLAKHVSASSACDFGNICVGKLRSRIQNGAPSRPASDFMDFILEDKNRSTMSEDGAEEKSFSHAQFRSLVADSAMMMNAGRILRWRHCH